MKVQVMDLGEIQERTDVNFRMLSQWAIAAGRASKGENLRHSEEMKQSSIMFC